MDLGFSKWENHGNMPDNEELTLSDIIRGLQHCINSSAEIADQHYLTEFRHFFDDDGTPIKQTIKIADNHSIDVPLICMTEHSALLLDEMEVKLDVLLKNTALKSAYIKNADYVFKKMKRSALKMN